MRQASSKDYKDYQSDFSNFKWVQRHLSPFMDLCPVGLVLTSSVFLPFESLATLLTLLTQRASGANLVRAKRLMPAVQVTLDGLIAELIVNFLN